MKTLIFILVLLETVSLVWGIYEVLHAQEVLDEEEDALMNDL